eukprot:g3320.t1
MMSSFERRIKAEQDTVLFWKRRCQTKDTLVQRLQAIISEQKTMLTRIGAFTTKSSSSKQPDKITRGWRIPGHKASFTHNAEDDDERGSSRRKGYRYGRFDKDDTKLDRHARSRLTRDTSHVLLDIPGGVHGNVELNLSWPPATSSIESEDEEDDEIVGDGPTPLSTIEETVEEEVESRAAAQESSKRVEDVEKETQPDEVTPHTGSEESSVSSSIELSRSLQSDDSGLLFERYLE